MKKFDYVIFDLDGTLTDNGIGITNSVTYALKKYGITPPPREELYKFVGPPLVNSFMEYYGLTPENAQKCVLYYREYFNDKGIRENVILPGAKELLIRLKNDGYTLILATGKPEAAAKIVLENFGISEYFSCVCGVDPYDKLLTKAEVIARALEVSGADPSRSVMVGDRMHDVIGSKAFNIPCIGVTFGYGSEEELKNAGAVFLAHSFDDVWEYITK